MKDPTKTRNQLRAEEWIEAAYHELMERQVTDEIVQAAFNQATKRIRNETD